MDLTLPSPAENLALDEALLDEAEAGQMGELLRLWSPDHYAVILGRHSQRDVEVNLDFCEAEGIPVLRRMSGGATILYGPGCLMSSVLLSYERRTKLRDLSFVHEFVLGKVAEALPKSKLRGTSDLAIADQKISGNSLRCKRNHLLYHGTLLFDFRLEMIGQALLTPPRQPDYRAGRAHDDFVTNYPATEADLRAGMVSAWQATAQRTAWPQERVARLVEERYANAAWTNAR